MTTTLRLDSRFAPLWRDVDTLQFGLRGTITVDSPLPWQLQLVSALRSGVPAGELGHLAAAFGARASDVDEFIGRIAGALERQRPAPRFSLSASPRVPTQTVQAFQRALIELGGIFDAAATVIVLTAHVTTPRDVGELSSQDRTHLPVTFGCDDVTIGPLITPGISACAQCLVANAADDDPAWPTMAAQLLDAPLPQASAASVIEAAALALRLLGTASATRVTRSVSVDRELRRSWHQHRPHEDCGCQSLAGIATAAAAPSRLIATS